MKMNLHLPNITEAMFLRNVLLLVLYVLCVSRLVPVHAEVAVMPIDEVVQASPFLYEQRGIQTVFGIEEVSEDTEMSENIFFPSSPSTENGTETSFLAPISHQDTFHPTKNNTCYYYSNRSLFLTFENFRI